MASVIRLNQERWARAAGWQLTQWVSREPAGATYPNSLEAPFLVRDVGGRESFERVATLSDLAAYPERNLRRFEVRGPNGDQFYSNVSSGDTLRVTGDSTLHWLQTSPPYADRSFTVNSGLLLRANGAAPIMLPGGLVSLPGYTFSAEDVGRWFEFSGFATTAFNGFCQIRSVRGNLAQTSKTSAVQETSAGGWFSYVVSVESNAGAGLEPRFFPSKMDGLAWELDYAPGLTLSGTGGATRRESEVGGLYRAARWTSVEPSLAAALDFMAVVQNGIKRLNDESNANVDGASVVVVTNFT